MSVRSLSPRRLLVAGCAVGAIVALIALLAAGPTARPTDEARADTVALTPPMGWNDWNAFGCAVSAELVEQSADALVTSGMKAAGYQYVNIDDCWMTHDRDPRTGRLVPDPAKFPDGIAAVARYVHSRGLKLGIYEDAGTATCAGFPGSLGHERIDADTFAEWGVDYLKYDNCHHGDSTSTGQYVDRYVAMRDALRATGRPILYSLCEWGVNKPWAWARGVGHAWRTTRDIADNYGSMLAIFTANVQLAAYAKPGGWNDPDMLEIGNGGMTPTEQRTEFSLWAAMAAPLIAGTDLRTISAADLAIYSNPEVIAIDQDPLGKQAVPIASAGEPAGSHGLWVLSKPLAGGARAVVLFNSTDAEASIETTASRVGLGVAPRFALRDLWTGTETTTTGVIRAVVPARGVVMYRVAR
jgi:alpha-galactosidase